MALTTRRELLRASAAAACLQAAPTALRAQAAPAFPSWVAVPPERLTRWTLLPGNDPLRCVLANAPATDPARMRVMMLFPRRSSAYDIALATIMEAFDRRGVAVEFDLVNALAGDLCDLLAQRVHHLLGGLVFGGHTVQRENLRPTAE